MKETIVLKNKRLQIVSVPKKGLVLKTWLGDKWSSGKRIPEEYASLIKYYRNGMLESLRANRRNCSCYDSYDAGW